MFKKLKQAKIAIVWALATSMMMLSSTFAQTTGQIVSTVNWQVSSWYGVSQSILSWPLGTFLAISIGATILWLVIWFIFYVIGKFNRWS